MTQIRRSDLAAALLGLAAAGISLWAVPGTVGILGAGLALLMAAIARIDARYLLIPNELNAAALALALVHAAAVAPLVVIESMVWAGVRGTLTMLLFSRAATRLPAPARARGLGLGDVKLAFVAGAWLDWTMIPVRSKSPRPALCSHTWLGARSASKPIDATTRLPLGCSWRRRSGWRG